MSERVCVVCGGSIEYRVRQAVTCGGQCQKTHTREHQRKLYKARRSDVGSRHCVVCGINIEHRRTDLKVCSGVCRKERRKILPSAHPDRKKERRAAWYEKNRDREIENARRWAQENPERVKAAKAAWYEKNRDVELEKARRWAQENPERVKARKRRYQQQDTDAIKALRDFGLVPAGITRRPSEQRRILSAARELGLIKPRKETL